MKKTLIIFNQDIQVYYRKKLHKFDNVVDMISFLKTLEEKYIYIINVDISINKTIESLKPFMSTKYKANYEFDKFIIDNMFGNKIYLKIQKKIINKNYVGTTKEILKECMSDWEKFYKVYPNFQDNIKPENIIYNDWKEMIDYKNNMEDKIIKEEYEWFKTWCTNGFFWYNEKNSDKIVNNVNGFDKRSYFSYISSEHEVPYGEPIYNCKLEKCKHKLGLMIINITATIKENYIPFVNIHLGNDFLRIEGEKEVSIEELDNDVIYVTYQEFDLILDHYNVEDIEILDNICFKSKKGLCKPFVDKWISIQDSVEDDWLKKSIKKGINRIYGKTNEKILLDIKGNDGKRYEVEKDKIPYNPFYLFIINQSRNLIIKEAQQHYENLLTIQCDSIYLKDNGQIVDHCKDKKVGYFKTEVSSKYGYIKNANLSIYWDDDKIKRIKHGSYSRKELKDKTPDKIIEYINEDHHGI